MNKSQLDEMQLQKRNHIGNQAFVLLSYLLLIDIALYGFGFRWLQYPTNVFILMMAAMAYYLIRSILSNTLLGPGISSVKTGAKFILVLLISGIAAYIAVSTLSKGFGASQLPESDGISAYILFGFSILTILAAAVAGFVVFLRNKNSKD